MLNIQKSESIFERTMITSLEKISNICNMKKKPQFSNKQQVNFFSIYFQN